jgi:transposase
MEVAMKNALILKEKVGAQIKDVFKSSEDARFVRKIDVLALVCQGNSIKSISELFKISRMSITTWINQANEQGLNSLRAKQKPGRKSKVDTLLELSLSADLEKEPSALGYENTTWDGILLSHHLEKNYKVELSTRQCQRLFHKLNFSPKASKKSTAKAIRTKGNNKTIL